MAYSDEERQEIYTRVCDEIAGGSSIRKVCALEGMPTPETIYVWLRDCKEFSERYARAQEARAHFRIERIGDTADEVKAGTITPDVGRVAIDADKWLAGRENQRRYGDRQTLQGADDAPPIRTQGSIDPADKRDLARWIALKLTTAAAGAKPAEGGGE